MLRKALRSIIAIPVALATFMVGTLAIVFVLNLFGVGHVWSPFPGSVAGVALAKFMADRLQPYEPRACFFGFLIFGLIGLVLTAGDSPTRFMLAYDVAQLVVMVGAAWYFFGGRHRYDS